MKRRLYLAPFCLLLALAGALALGLSGDKTSSVDARRLGQPFPAFTLPTLENGAHLFSSANLKGKVTLVNLFASWCTPCIAEHDSLMKLAATRNLTLVGIAWKDTPQKISAYLKQRGNPFAHIGIDQQGATTVPLALTGIPETFLLDKTGVIVYHYNSALTDEVVRDTLLPLIEKLQHDAPPPR